MVNIYVDGRRIILSQNETQLSLSAEQAGELGLHLQILVKRLLTEKQQEQEQVKPLLEDHQKARLQWENHGEEEIWRQTADLFHNGKLKEGQQLLLSHFGEQGAYDAVAAALQLDAEGWASPREGWSEWSVPALCHMAATAPSTHLLARLWAQGCLDAMLLSAGQILKAEYMLTSLQPRLFSLLAQECYIPAGEFTLGSAREDAWDFEKPAHQVSLSKGFYMGRFPITQMLYFLVMGHNPSRFQSASRPVETVSWMDAVRFCNAYSALQGAEAVYLLHDDGKVTWNPTANGYRLPTEAEWECAAKAWQDRSYAGSDTLADVGWFRDNSGEHTHGVGLKLPNAAGFYDLSGNVWEWCWDGYAENAYWNPVHQDPTGADNSLYKSCRGAAYTSQEASAYLTMRGRFAPDVCWEALGFRIVRNEPTKEGVSR